MLISSELLTKLAREEVARRTRSNHDIVAIYITGSALSEEPLIGGSTDIDLVFVHKENPPVEREVKRISYEVSFDIQHHHQSFYTFHRRLRLNPWLGPALSSHQSILYDTDHWLEFIQAGVSSSYDRPETIHARAFPFAEKARQQWFELGDPQEIPYTAWIDLYFKAVFNAANAIAVLNGPALTTRRLLLDFAVRAEAVDSLPLAGVLARLAGTQQASAALYADWRSCWENALLSASKAPNPPVSLHPARKAYYMAACDSLVESGSLHAALWPLLESWRLAAATLADQPAQQEAWISFLAELDFTPEGKAKEIEALDAFIDAGEALLSDWKNEYGL
jgi:hypothetical protein